MDTGFRRVLLATEHGEFDVGAETLAFALARQHGRRLMVVLPCLSNPEFEAAAPLLAARADDEASSHRMALRAMAAEAGIELDLRVRHGDSLDEEILEDARERTADLIVIRRRGRASFLSRLLIGERVGRVIERAPCSVLMAPRAARPWTQRVLAAVDPGSPQAGVASAGAAIARESGLELQLLAVVPDEAAIPGAHLALAGVLQQARDSGVAADAAVRVGRAADEIIAGTREAGCDLLVVGRSRRSGRRPGLGGTAREVVGRAEGPVLIHAGPEPGLSARS